MSIRSTHLLHFEWLLICFVSVSATTSFGEPTPNAPPQDQGAPTATTITTSYEFWLSILVLILGAMVLLAQTILFIRQGDSAGPGDILKSYVVTFVVAGTLLALTAGFDGDQIAPAMGLFGTIVGYLLGRESDWGQLGQKSAGDTDQTSQAEGPE